MLVVMGFFVVCFVILFIVMVFFSSFCVMEDLLFFEVIFYILVNFVEVFMFGVIYCFFFNIVWFVVGIIFVVMGFVIFFVWFFERINVFL